MTPNSNHDAFSASPNGSHNSSSRYTPQPRDRDRDRERDDHEDGQGLETTVAQQQRLEEYYANAHAQQQQHQAAMQEYQRSAAQTNEAYDPKKERRYRLPRLG